MNFPLSCIPHTTITGLMAEPQPLITDTLTLPYEANSVAGTVLFARTSLGPMSNNTWLIGTDEGEALLIDAADNAPFLVALAQKLQLTITDVLTTHRHSDHIGALNNIIEATQARHHAPRYDAEALPAAADITYGLDTGQWQPLEPAGRSIEKLGLMLNELRGHTPGGLAIYFQLTQPHHVWVGDSVFPGGVGRTTCRKDFLQLIDDVDTRIFSLPETTVIHPGHGRSTYVGEEKIHIQHWRQRGW